MSTTTPGAFAAALQEKRRRERRRQFLGWGGAGSVLVVIGFLVWLFAMSPVFRVHDVTVSGTDMLAKEAVLEAAVVPANQPMLGLDTDAIAERIRLLPAVRDVTVGRDFPDTILIDVVERTVVYQRVDGSSYESVDADGVVFVTSNSPTEGIVQAVTAGKDPRLLRDVAEVVSNIPEKLLPRVERVQAKAVDRITLELDEGDLVVWGSAEQSQLKGDVLVALIDVDARLYDVSAPSYPTTK